jgi:hypothetical protein
MFLVIADNSLKGKYKTRSIFDILGNIRFVIDAKGRIIAKKDFDIIRNIFHVASIDGGERWILDNAIGKVILTWDSRD